MSRAMDDRRQLPGNKSGECERNRTMTRIAINGLGRIGRAVFKTAMDHPELEVVAINDLLSPENLVYLLRFDSVDGRYHDVVGISEDEMVSTDIIGDPRATVVDLTMTKVVNGRLVKVLGWYVNEWGYAAQMVREAAYMGGVWAPEQVIGAAAVG